MVAATDSGDAVLGDIWSNNEYTGNIISPEGFKETAIRAGHVISAVNVPWHQAVQEDGRFKSAEDFQAL